MTSKEVALIVGASRGIGMQIAVDLAKNGYAGECYGLPYKTSDARRLGDHS